MTQESTAVPVPSIPPDRFGRDHWSLLAYVETCCVDAPAGSIGKGRLDPRRLRVRNRIWPAWKAEWDTRLRGTENGPTIPLPDHDDMDCLLDLEAAGLVDIVSNANLFVRLTDAGIAMAAKLREHKARGGQVAEFTGEQA